MIVHDAPEHVATPPAEAPLCDVVIKGGVASGVIYPRFLAALAKCYRFDSIGGTSAGAMAAAAGAIAQLAKCRGLVGAPKPRSRLRISPTW